MKARGLEGSQGNGEDTSPTGHFLQGPEAERACVSVILLAGLVDRS